MRNYRILRIAGVHYQEAIDLFQRANPDAQSLSSGEFLDRFLGMKAIYSDGFSRNMKLLGNEAWELLYDFEPLQKKWAAEHGVAYDAKRWKIEILLAQIRHHRPDILYMQDVQAIPFPIRKNLKDDYPFLKLLIAYKGFTGAEGELGNIDLLAVGNPMLRRHYMHEGVPIKLLYHAFDESILEHLERCRTTTPRTPYDLTFIGSSGYGFGTGHQSRYWDLVRLIRDTDLMLWVYDRMSMRDSQWRIVDAILAAIRTLSPILGDFGIADGANHETNN